MKQLAQKIFYSLAVIASLLLVLDIAAPWMTQHILAPYRSVIAGWPEVNGQIVVYILLQLLTVAGLLLFMRFFNAKQTELGIGKMRYWFTLPLTPLIWVGYMIISLGVTVVLSAVFPEFNSSEKQAIGLLPDDSHNLLLVALFLCIAVPLAEEFAFRGYLFGLLRKKLSFVATALLVSLTFAVLHLMFTTGENGELLVKQLNAGADVFILSLILCYLRERTQAIWAGVALHALKNLVAFLYIFVYNIG